MNKGHVLGIDIGSSCIKVFAGRMQSGHIDIVGHGTAPSSGFSKGVLVDTNAVAAAVKEAVDCVQMACSIPLGPAYVGIGGTAVTSLNCRGSVAPADINVITQEDVNRVFRAASLTAIPDNQRIIHTLPRKFWVDGQAVVEQPTGLKGKCLEAEIHAVTVTGSVHDDLLSCLEAVGINVAAVVANAVANTYAIPTKPGKCSLIVDMGAGTTDIALCDNGTTVFTASLPLGDHYITNDIVLGIGVSHTHAEQIKRYYTRLSPDLLGKSVILDCNDYGTTDKNVPYDFLHKIIESRIAELVELIHDFVRPVIADVLIDNIVLTGAPSAMPSLVRELQQRFSLPVEIANLQAVVPEYNNPANTACYGIIQYAAQKMPVCEQNERPLLSLWDKIRNMF